MVQVPANSTGAVIGVDCLNFQTFRVNVDVDVNVILNEVPSPEGNPKMYEARTCNILLLRHGQGAAAAP